MSKPLLVIGHKRYSSWSQRGWLALKLAGIDFEELKLELFTEDYHRKIKDYSPAGKVPALKLDGYAVWDSLAILEWAAEQPGAKPLWPQDPEARAVARSVVAEMHSGFADLRRDCSSNYGRRYKGFAPSAGALADAARITEIWRFCREKYGEGGDFLFGASGAAEAFYAPVVGRFITYDLPADPVSRKYIEAVRALPDVEDWYRAGHQEQWIVENYERGLPERD